MLLGERHSFGRTGDRSCGAGGQWRADVSGDPPRRDLVAKRFDRGRRRADPGQPGGDDLAGEVRVLRQEPVPGMHGVRAGIRRHLEDLADVQVTVGGGQTAQCIGLIGDGDVQGIQIWLGIHGDAGQPGITAGARDPDGDLATVGDEDLAHEMLLLNCQESSEPVRAAQRPGCLPLRVALAERLGRRSPRTPNSRERLGHGWVLRLDEG